MENIDNGKLIDVPLDLTKEEQQERAWRQAWKEKRISRARANVLRKQITEAYEILENIRFDYLGDTMFRDYIVKAKRELEGALSDFLLDDTHWSKRIDEIRNMTPEEYDISQKEITSCQGQPTK
jgi:hypothetical protein